MGGGAPIGLDIGSTSIRVVETSRGKDGLTRGRPVGVSVDPRGALIVADDLSNTIWRVTPNTPSAAVKPAAPATTTGAAPAASAGEAKM